MAGSGWYQYGPEDNPVKFQKRKFRDHADAAMEWADTLNPGGIMRPLTDDEIAAEMAAEAEDDGS